MQLGDGSERLAQMQVCRIRWDSGLEICLMSNL